MEWAVDVFISYASPDRDWANHFAEALTSNGWGVWWDRDILTGASFQEAISDALERSRCVSVIWSTAALSSKYVMAEATRGFDRSVLHPVFKEKVALPVPFNIVQAADLTTWNGERNAKELEPVTMGLNKLLGEANVLPLAEGARIIGQFVTTRKIRVREVEGEVTSSTGAKAFKARADDGMGVVYCHRTGPYSGQVFYVRRGISIFYHDDHGGPEGALGLPISNEEVAEGEGHPTSYFENGLIEWSPKTWEAQAYRFAHCQTVKIGNSRKV
jgi:hypothetical protein